MMTQRLQKPHFQRIEEKIDRNIKTPKALMRHVFKLIADELLSGKSVELPGIGTLLVRDYKERQFHSPLLCKPGETLKLSASRKLKVNTYSEFKKKLNAAVNAEH